MDILEKICCKCQSDNHELCDVVLTNGKSCQCLKCDLDDQYKVSDLGYRSELKVLGFMFRTRRRGKEFIKIHLELISSSLDERELLIDFATRQKDSICIEVAAEEWREVAALREELGLPKR